MSYQPSHQRINKMRKVFTKKVIFLLAVQFAWSLVAWLVVPFFLIFAERISSSADGIKRYALPRFLRWAETPDEHLPGGMYEPTVEKLYMCAGWFITSWYWLALRNVGHGILWDQGWAVPCYPQHMTPEQMAQYGTQVQQRRILGLWFMWGAKTAADTLKTKHLEKGWYWAVPWWSVRLKKRGI